jgi:hypothetical protein
MMSPVDFSMITTAETLRIDARMLPSAIGLDSVSSDSLYTAALRSLDRVDEGPVLPRVVVL